MRIVIVCLRPGSASEGVRRISCELSEVPSSYWIRAFIDCLDFAPTRLRAERPELRGSVIMLAQRSDSSHQLRDLQRLIDQVNRRVSSHGYRP